MRNLITELNHGLHIVDNDGLKWDVTEAHFHVSGADFVLQREVRENGKFIKFDRKTVSAYKNGQGNELQAVFSGCSNE